MVWRTQAGPELHAATEWGYSLGLLDVYAWRVVMLALFLLDTRRIGGLRFILTCSFVGETNVSSFTFWCSAVQLVGLNAGLPGRPSISFFDTVGAAPSVSWTSDSLS